MRRRLLWSLIGVLVVALVGFGGNLAAGNHPSLGLDLQGGASVTLEPIGTFDPAALDVAVDIIRKRVDSIGVSEPEIIRQGNTVVVNLPGVKDQKAALELVGSSGEVLLRPVKQMGTAATTTTLPAGVTTTLPAGVTTTLPAGVTTTLPAGVTTTTPTATSGGPGSVRLAAATTIPATTSASDTTIPSLTESTAPTTTVVGVTDTVTLTEDDRDRDAVLPGEKDDFIYLVGPTGATGKVFNNNAKAEINNGAWAVVVSLRDGEQGADKWNALATACFNATDVCPTKQLAIVLDGKVISAPTVQEPVFSGGNVQITGSFTEKEATQLAKYLQFGAVPVRFSAPTVQTVSASLGKDSLKAAIVSGLVGILLVLLFLLFYYRVMALVVFAGLTVSGLLLWSIISWLSKTNGLALTLSGTAGIIVSIGVTVDSYVVFFERLKDDVQSGRTLKNSAQRGFESAWRTILAADTVSLIGALVLWWLTVGSVRGFAFFLGLSTLTDIVVSYFFTRPTVLLLSRTRFLNSGRVLGVRRAPTIATGDQ
ncbi:MAG: protein translocase subunit SecD [Ilumatobacteraceae bacterium]|nr:protein translocase subunit SecD [Ilumatobacteraceae bacterium]